MSIDRVLILFSRINQTYYLTAADRSKISINSYLITKSSRERHLGNDNRYIYQAFHQFSMKMSSQNLVRI
jgi:hypothetical protein